VQAARLARDRGTDGIGVAATSPSPGRKDTALVGVLVDACRRNI